ncbi:MAG: phospholipase D family protein, partial [Roseobacter sp.]|nr:phospholipase D family protein [Roseobacter sp.]
MENDDVLLAPLGDGNDALGARLRMIEQAHSSIDIKTFLIKPDTAGALIWLALYDAAERGVRIRLLYDDVFTSASDAAIATLDVHRNVEIRTFNPLSRNSTRAMNFLLDFKRVNRRMHNKAFIVDGALAIVGGRNIADEYFQIETEAEFADFDLFIAGAPVRNLSAAFDLYWNDAWSVPLERLASGDPHALPKASQELLKKVNNPAAKIYQRAVDSTYLRDLRIGKKPVFRGRARIIVDQPGKLRTPPGIGPFDVGNAFYNTLLRAEHEVLVISPYFVPEDYGADVFETLVARGIRVRIVTNSLASTNHTYVHGGYSKYRERLLKSGIEIFELRSDAPSILGESQNSLVLHSKLAIVDEKTLFVSSTNIDPRSIRQNSEIATIVESAELAGELLQHFNTSFEDYV